MLDKLRKLQTDYIRLIENEEPRHVEVLQDYLDLVESIKNNIRRESMKFAKSILNDSRFAEAFISRSASLYIPVLSLLQVVFRGHRHLAQSLLVKEKASDSFCELINHVFDHVDLAHDSLTEDLDVDTREAEGSYPTLLYGFEESMLILDLSIKWLKSVIDPDPESKISAAVVQACPKAANCLSKCAILINSSDLERIATTLTRAQEDRAARIIQSFWRTILAARKWAKMRRGFRLFQIAFKNRLRDRESKLLNEFDESEKNFELNFKLIWQERIETEKAYKKLLNAPAKSVLKFELAKRHLNKKITTDDLDAQGSSNPEIEKAVLILQYHIRRWLLHRRRQQDWKKVFHSGQGLTEEKVVKIQEEIQNWQYKNKVTFNSPSDVLELHQRAQSMLTKYCQTFQASRQREQKSLQILAQTKSMTSFLETAPTLSGHSGDQWYLYHSLPQHVAVKARLEHEESLRLLDLPSWKRTLMKFG